VPERGPVGPLQTDPQPCAPPARTAAKGAVHSGYCTGLGRPRAALVTVARCPGRSSAASGDPGSCPRQAPATDCYPPGGEGRAPGCFPLRKVTPGATLWSGSATRGGPRSSPARTWKLLAEPQLPDPGVRSPTRRRPRPPPLQLRVPARAAAADTHREAGPERAGVAHAGGGGESQRREAHGHDEASERHLRGPESQHDAGTARALAQAGQAAGQRVRTRCAGAAGRRHLVPQALSALRSSHRGAGASCAGCGDRLPAGSSRGCGARPTRAARAGRRAGRPQPAPVPAPMPPPLRRARRPRCALSRSPARPRAPLAERGREPPCRARAAAGFGSEPSRCAPGPGREPKPKGGTRQGAGEVAGVSSALVPPPGPSRILGRGRTEPGHRQGQRTPRGPFGQGVGAGLWDLRL
jgi:hypothetical protein